jgi:hypothetical protein
MIRSWNDLLTDVHEVAPQVADAQEIAALVESFGYNDRSVRQWGFANVFGLAQHMFLNFPQESRSEKQVASPSKWLAVWTETKSAARKLSASLAYSVPWMALLVLEYLRPHALQVSPEFGSALSLSLIASLVTPGGFIQMIARAGSFYSGLLEPFLAHRFCVLLLKLGAASTVLLAVLGVLLGAYFHVFPGVYLLVAAANYVALSVLWMFCAILSAQGIGWCIPLVFLVSAAAGASIKIFAHTGTPLPLMLWPVLAAFCAAVCTQIQFWRSERKRPQRRDSARPRFGVAMISLVPFYLYGTVYFGFLFADRFAAGTAIPWFSGLSFGIDGAYKRGMDVVLLAFLICAALVEYLSESYLRFWFQLAAELPQSEGARLVSSLQKRHSRIMCVIFAVFVTIALLAWFAFNYLSGLTVSPRFVETVAMGGVGYLMLSMALFETIILACVNALHLALRALALGLAVNLLAGYGLSHLLGVQYAAVGLLAGAAVVLWKCNAAARQVLQHPDYHYSVA